LDDRARGRSRHVGRLGKSLSGCAEQDRHEASARRRHDGDRELTSQKEVRQRLTTRRMGCAAFLHCSNDSKALLLKGEWQSARLLCNAAVSFGERGGRARFANVPRIREETCAN